jgi:hypothetical protein
MANGDEGNRLGGGSHSKMIESETTDIGTVSLDGR